MAAMEDKAPHDARPGGRLDVRFGASALRLSGRQWAVAGLAALAFFVFAPNLWERVEKLDPPADYRLPYDLSNDYWLFSRYARLAAARGQTLVVGDSVMWGQYVKRQETLSHYLGERDGEPRFANLGLDGAHPAALAGLLRYYGGDIAGGRVLLHANLLWTASKKHDLQSEKEFRFNHPTLVPQFVPSIPCYTETGSKRLSIAIERQMPFFAWANHLRVAYFGQQDLPTWTMEHPTANPLGAMGAGLPTADDPLRHEPISWTARGIEKQDFAWVDLETSFQWRFFREAVQVLQARGNKVFVLVGPFNEHMLNDESLKVYAERKRTVAAWLAANQVPHLVPPPLPSDLYADASHPLAEGYRLLAQQLWENPEFSRFAADR